MGIARQSVVLALAGCLVSCSHETQALERGGASGAAAIELITVPEEVCLRVPLDESVERIVQVHNPTSEPLEVSRWRSSCSCIRIGEVPPDLVFDPDGVVDVPLVIHSRKSGMKDEQILLLARQASGDEELLKLAVAVLTGPPVFTEPGAIRLSGRAGEAIESAFTVAIYLQDDEAARLSWETPPEGLAIEVEQVTQDEATAGVLERYSFRAWLPEAPPGAYTSSVAFWRGGADAKGSRIESSIVLLITE